MKDYFLSLSNLIWYFSLMKNDPIQNNRILFFETTETLLDMVSEPSDVRVIERFLTGTPTTIDQRKACFPDKFAVHVHQICLTYLVSHAPFQIQVDSKLVHITATKAAQSPIPLTVFDNLLDEILEVLFEEVFPRFAQHFHLVDPAKLQIRSHTPQKRIEREKRDSWWPTSNRDSAMTVPDDDNEIRCALPRHAPVLDRIEEVTEPDYDPDYAYSESEYSCYEPAESLRHKTSSIFAYIHENAPSIFSEIELDDRDADFDDEHSEADTVLTESQAKYFVHDHDILPHYTLERKPIMTEVQQKPHSWAPGQKYYDHALDRRTDILEPLVNIPSLHSEFVSTFVSPKEDVSQMDHPIPSRPYSAFEKSDVDQIVSHYQPHFQQRSTSIQRKKSKNWKRTIKKSLKKYFNEI
jgi:hypothetical protein